MCAKQLHCRVGTVYSELLASWKLLQRQDDCGEDLSGAASQIRTAVESLSSNGEEEVKQTLFCEAFHRVIEEFDEEVRSNGDGGTTLSSLFLFPCYEEGGQLNGMKVVAANIGDSRLLAITVSPSDDQSGANNGNTRLNKDLNQSLHSLSSSEHYDGAKHDQLSTSAHSYFNLSPVQTINNSATGSSKTTATTITTNNKGKNAVVAVSRAHPLSSDHKLSLDRERYRVENAVAIRPQALPWSLDPIFHNDVDNKNTDGSCNKRSAVHFLPVDYSFPHDDDMPHTIAPSKERKDPLDDTHHDKQSIVTMSSLIEEAGAKVRLLSGLVPASVQSLPQQERKEDDEIKVEVDDTRPQLILPSHGHLVTSLTLFSDRSAAVKHQDAALKHGRRLQEVSSAMSALRPALSPPYNSNKNQRSSENNAEGQGHQQQSLVVNRQESFIACRAIIQQSILIRGPLAYHGRFGRSVLMTRSIGDRLGPRGCIPCAELTSMYVPYTSNSETTVRVVLATDGLWDVIDNDTVRRAAAWFKHQSSSALAVYLARKAVRRRVKQNLRRDDVTVTVVDLNVNKHGKRLFLQSNKSVEGRPCKAIALTTNEDKDKELLVPIRRQSDGKISPTESTKGKASVIRVTDELDLTVHNIQPSSHQSGYVDTDTNLLPIAVSNGALSGSSNWKKVSPVSSSSRTTPSTESQVLMNGYYHCRNHGSSGPMISGVQPLPPEGAFGDRCIIS